MGCHIAVYPGSFDPITFGHIDIVRRAASIFDTVVVAVAAQSGKSTLFSLDERTQLVAESCSKFENVRVIGFSGILVDFVRAQSSRVIIRGLRAVSDFEYEFAMSLMNNHLASEIETVLLPTSEGYSFVSSSMIKEVFMIGGDVKGKVPDCVLTALAGKFRA